jgi:MoxR-like ATPase
MGKMEAARKATLIASPIEKANLSRCIRVWADYYALHQELPVRRQGAHAKIASFIADEKNAKQLRVLLRGMPRNTCTAETFAQRVSDKYVQLFISARTAFDRMNTLGFHPGGLQCLQGRARESRCSESSRRIYCFYRRSVSSHAKLQWA